jgi:hypothetical protein
LLWQLRLLNWWSTKSSISSHKEKLLLTYLHIHPSIYSPTYMFILIPLHIYLQCTIHHGYMKTYIHTYIHIIYHYTYIGKAYVLWHLVSFVLYWWDPSNYDASNHILGLFGKLSRRRGALARFHGVWTCSVKVLEYWMISSMKIKLSCSWKCWRNWMPLVLLERS